MPSPSASGFPGSLTRSAGTRLREPDPDVVLDLPSIITHCYDNGAYAVRVDYDQPPPEPFRPADEAWADTLLRNAGLRGQSSGGDSEAPGA
jgi:hypothetical protein